VAVALTATLNTSPAGVPRVLLSVTGATGPDVFLYRVEPSGRVVEVRGAAPVKPFTAPSAIVYHYEAPCDQAVSY
jgi:hypothetical protein